MPVGGGFRVVLGAPTPELAATLPDGQGSLIRRTPDGIEATYQYDRRQPAVRPRRQVMDLEWSGWG